MSFRSRLALAFLFATIIPLGVLAYGVRRQLTTRLVQQHERRVRGLADVAAEDLDRESVRIAARLSSLTRSLRTDDRLRLALIRGDGSDRAYVLDWAEQAMLTAGLSMLQLQDDDGRIVSSGHFRNEFDRLDVELPHALAAVRKAVLVRVRAPEGPFLALARIDSVSIGNRTFDVIAGTRVDSTFLQRFAREEGLAVSLVTSKDTVIPSGGREAAGVEESPSSRQRDPSTGTMAIPHLPADGGLPARNDDVVSEFDIPAAPDLTPAKLVITYTIPELAALRRDIDRWFVGALLAVFTGVVALAAWFAARLSGPLTTLAHAASTIDLEGPELAIAAGRDDEIGTLARRLGGLSTRLRASAARLRQAERRATVGDMARQVNHDIKNGLIPIRNVLRHLVQVQEQQPQELASVFAERRSTLESSVGYLDTLARNYARLTPRVDQRAVDVNAIAEEIATSTATAGNAKVRTRLADSLPRALGDPVIIRRILDNLVRNGIESLDSNGGEVTITTSRTQNGAARIVVADTGRGMSEQELARAFDDFYTTKPEGTGLGLSVVRRLTADLNGSLRVESEPGRGTTFTIELPACTPS